MTEPGAVRVSTRVEVDPATAFRLFTEEIDAWWRDEPRFRWHGGPGGRMRLEPGVNGRFLEIHDEAGGDFFEVGRVRIWEPPHRLVFSFRARAFAPDESTEVEVRFEKSGDATEVTLEHRGWDALRLDHPVRHGLDREAFRERMGLWWAELLGSARRHANGSRSRPMASTEQGFDLETTYLFLDGPLAKRVEVGPDFWQTIDARTDLSGRMVGIFRYETSWDSWEIHPDGDEVVTLLRGSVDLVLDEPGGERIVALRGRGTAVVPAGIWHTATVHAPSEALHITRGAGTRHRPR